jgi:WD40 repeat protein
VAGIVYKDKQVFVSASEDGSVYVWDRGAVYASWPHKVPVHALACTRPENKTQMVLTGCDDGKARLWSLAEMGSEKPTIVLETHHEGGVQAAAFSPDGSKCVTSDDRGEIFLSDTATGKKLYAFPRMHNSTVGCLHFTPQCTVISVGKDNTAIVWKMGEKSASTETSLYCSGEVGSLGVTDDGGQMLLDLDKNRLRVVDLHKTRNLGTLQQGAEGGKFAGFALFSPSIGDKPGNRTILTTAMTDGILQVWRWSAGGGRGAELRKLVCTNNVPPTCAAFTPLAKDGFIIAGTRKGDVYIWPMPTADDIANRFKATITYVAENTESNGKNVRIYAEYQNSTEPNSRLRPGTTATLVIPQK